MKNFLQKHGKTLSVFFSVVCSVFLVAVIVSAATTIGTDISTGNLTVTGNAGISGVLSPSGGISTSTLDNVAVGASTPSSGKFTTLQLTGVFTPSGGISTSTFDNITIGNSTAAVGKFTTLTSNSHGPTTNNAYDLGAYGTAWRNIYVSGTIYGITISTSTFDNITIGASTPSTGKFTSLQSTGLFTPTGGISTSTLDAIAVGSSTPSTGKFTLLTSYSHNPISNNSYDLGAYGTAWRNIYVSGTIYGITISTSTLDNVTIGGSTKAAGSFTTLTSTGVYTPTGGISTTTLDNVIIGGNTKQTASFTSVTSTSHYPSTNNNYDIGSYGNAWRTIYASSSLKVGGSSTATTTIDFSNSVSTTGKGTCIILTGTDGTKYYLSVTSTPNASAPWSSITISTVTCQ